MSYAIGDFSGLVRHIQQFQRGERPRPYRRAAPARLHARQQQEAAEHDSRFRRQVHVGLDSAKVGRLVPAEAVEAECAARGAKTRR